MNRIFSNLPSEASMKSQAALLRRSGQGAPYAATAPFEIIEVDLDGPREGEVLVRVTAAGVCHSDLSVLNGSRPRPLPLIGGHEATGIVEALGSGVSNLIEGDHVSLVFMPSCRECNECRNGIPAFCSIGSAANVKGELIRGGTRISYKGEKINHYNGVSCYSQYAIMDERSLVKIPSDLPKEIAAIFGCALLTGIGAVRQIIYPWKWIVAAKLVVDPLQSAFFFTRISAWTFVLSCSQKTTRRTGTLLSNGGKPPQYLRGLRTTL